jgi:hypothetical protein
MIREARRKSRQIKKLVEFLPVCGHLHIYRIYTYTWQTENERKQKKKYRRFGIEEYQGFFFLFSYLHKMAARNNIKQARCVVWIDSLLVLLPWHLP